MTKRTVPLEIPRPFRGQGAGGNDRPLPADGRSEELALQIYSWSLPRGAVKVREAAEEFHVSRLEAEQALRLLRDLKLVRLDESTRTFSGESPSAAQVELIAPMERRIHEQQSSLAAAHRRLKRFSDIFSTSQRAQLRQETIVVTEDEEQLRLRLADAARHCSSEMLVMQAGAGETRRLFGLVWPLTLQALGRGVSVRTLHQHTVRTDTDARGRVHEAVAAGADARTSDDLFGHLVVFDSRAALVLLPSPSGDTVKPLMVYDPTLVEILRRFHDHAWHAAVEFEDGSTSYGGTLDAVKSAILQLLSSGLKDEVVARRLGMSPRTFRRHISGIMEELRAESRFQAGAAAARAGLLGLDGAGCPRPSAGGGGAESGAAGLREEGVTAMPLPRRAGRECRSAC
ncbi:hypothetical protein GCM10010387_46400 [Streptomyces inusitatus]|uniref:HTH luxR-type domain-containing protein n=1 Tax=Streptomyces inusitatus TaxID=68221 RepID=A0A918V021_9ACTN|nr:LuxR C-terminal-related transcriptional regulator [Streptomyces inusitatus]GGZ46668.1 hypothetical protein GCM10010387_46400 [Streptomyces inusitatus]